MIILLRISEMKDRKKAPERRGGGGGGSCRKILVPQDKEKYEAFMCVHV